MNIKMKPEELIYCEYCNKEITELCHHRSSNGPICFDCYAYCMPNKITKQAIDELENDDDLETYDNIDEILK